MSFTRTQPTYLGRDVSIHKKAIASRAKVRGRRASRMGLMQQPCRYSFAAGAMTIFQEHHKIQGGEEAGPGSAAAGSGRELTRYCCLYNHGFLHARTSICATSHNIAKNYSQEQNSLLAYQRTSQRHLRCCTRQVSMFCKIDSL